MTMPVGVEVHRIEMRGDTSLEAVSAPILDMEYERLLYLADSHRERHRATAPGRGCVKTLKHSVFGCRFFCPSRVAAKPIQRNLKGRSLSRPRSARVFTQPRSN